MSNPSLEVSIQSLKNTETTDTYHQNRNQASLLSKDCCHQNILNTISEELTTNDYINPTSILNKSIENKEIVIKNEHDHVTIDHGLNSKLNTFNITSKTEENDESLTEKSSTQSEDHTNIDVFSHLDEGNSIPAYKLRAESQEALNSNDWIRAPLYFDEQAISELTNEQIQTTLDYFILSGNRVSQMTKTYYDIEAVTKLLDEKEKDLELAATIGKSLLERDTQLESKIEYLELEVEKASEMVNQLRYDINIKDNLLKTFIDSESDNYLTYPDVSQLNNKKIDNEIVNECRYKIQDLEDENDLLRTKYEFLERETTDLETKESVIIESCFKEIDEANYNLEITEERLKNKSDECGNKQEQIQELFNKIFDLQSTVKSLTKENQDLESSYEGSLGELIEQINDLKEKYNECLKVLSRTQEDLILVKKRSPKKLNSVNLLNKYKNNKMNVDIESNIHCDDDDSNGEELLISQLEQNVVTSSRYSSVRRYRSYSNVPTNSNSLATEVFCSMAKDYRFKNNLSQQAYQSSDFIKKVKQKLTKQIPGSNIDSCMQSDSETESLLSNLNHHPNYQIENQRQMLINSNNSPFRLNQSHSSNFIRQFNSCTTPDSMLSTGSASVYSNLIAKSNSFLLPEKLQIVKPIEGSQTLQHWQNLARPNMGCLFETRPGITMKCGNNSDTERNYLENNDKNIKTNYDSDSDNEDDGVNLEMYDDDYDDEFNINDSEINFDNQSDLLFGDNYDYTLDHNNQNLKNTEIKRGVVLSPSRVKILSDLLKNEEMKSYVNTNNESSYNTNNESSQNSFFYKIGKYFTANNRNKKDYELDNPDTPPSSPINLPNNSGSNVLYDAIKSAFVRPLSNYFQSKDANSTLILAPTPPGTPQNEIDEDYINSDEYKKSQEKFRETSSNTQTDHSNILYDAIKSAFVLPFSNYFQSKNANNTLLNAPTPPGTPQNELDIDYINSEEYKKIQSSTDNVNFDHSSPDNTKEASENFFDQIVNKLSLFSFKSVPDNNYFQPSITSSALSNKLKIQSKKIINNDNIKDNSLIIKPLPIYAKTLVITPNESISRSLQNEVNFSSKIIQENSINYFKFNEVIKVHSEEKDDDKDEDIEPELQILTELNKKCETPPPSPSKFSPPLPQEDDEDYNEEDFKKSAFVKVASLNPLINKTIDLNSLLGSLSSLKKNQRACKYY